MTRAIVNGAEVTLEMLERDPYPVFTSLQEVEPVAFVPSLYMWLVTRWDDVVHVCEHPEIFRSNTEPSWLRNCLGENMLTQPDVMSAVRSNRSVLRKVIEETLRWMSPVGTATRQTVHDVELAGTHIPAGSLAAACLSAANRDPRRRSHPDVFSLERREFAHLAFAIGEHRCLGEWLGRQQVRLAVERLLDRFTGIEHAQPVGLFGFEFRGPLALHVRLSSSPND